MKYLLVCVLISFSFHWSVKSDQTRCLVPPADYEELLKDHLEGEQQGFLFADKTSFIKDYLLAGKKIIITRPAKWGKSMNLNMLYRFVVIETDKQGNRKAPECRKNNLIFTQSVYQTRTGRAKQFPKLKVSDYPEAMSHQGIHPVLFVDFSQVLLEDGISVDLFRREYSVYFKDMLISVHPYLEKYKDDDTLTQIEKDRLARAFNRTQTLEDLPQSIPLVTKLLYHHFNKTPVWVMVDDYDRIANKPFLRFGPRSEVFKDLVGIMSNIYHMAFDTKQPYIDRVLLTGRLPYFRAEANLDDFDLYTMAEDMKFGEHYGFTDTEVKLLIEPSHFITPARASQITQWYSGFTCDRKTYLHNPFSTLQSVSNKGALKYFWKNRGMDLDGYVMRAMLNPKLVRNFHLVTAMKEIEDDEPPNNVTYADLIKESVHFSLLTHYGCLTITGKKGNVVVYKIPGLEARYVLLDNMRGRR